MINEPRERAEPVSATGTRRFLIGILVPDDGPIDYEWMRLERWLAGHGVGNVGTLIERPPAEGDHVFDDLMRIGEVENLLPGAERLIGAGADLVLWACTSGSFIGGPAWSRQQVEDLGRAVGRPATSTTLALIQAARAIGASEVDLLGTYPQPVTDVLAGCLEDSGIHVEQTMALGIQNGLGSFEVDLRKEVRRFVEGSASANRPILVPDTAINSLDLVEALEQLAERPIVTANQASVWWALRLAGHRKTIANAGSLFLVP